MAGFLTDLLESIVTLPGAFADVAMQGPIAALLVGLGALFVGLAVLAGGALTIGALVDLITPTRRDRVHRPRS